MVTPAQSNLRASRNRTMTIDDADVVRLRNALLFEVPAVPETSTIRSFAVTLLGFCRNFRWHISTFYLPIRHIISLRLSAREKFINTSHEQYEAWLDAWLSLTAPPFETDGEHIRLRRLAFVRSNTTRRVEAFHASNRITWEREKGRGAKRNWKNRPRISGSLQCRTNSRSISIKSKPADAFSLRTQKMASPRIGNGPAREIFATRILQTFGTDISVPFWSMPENTDHPTQKPEKLLAKIILASTDPGDLILDPFAGSGTTAVTAKKLGRNFVAIEADESYCLLAQKRLETAETDASIQGFADGVFWERNSQNHGR